MGHRLTIAIAACCLGLAATAAPAAGKGLISGTPVATGVALHGSPHRYLTLTEPGSKTTVVARVDRQGGRIDHWWTLPGRLTITAPAYDLVGAGLSADENVLVLSQPRQGLMVRRTRLTILNTEAHDRHPAARRNGDFSTVTLRGDYGVQALSPDGATAFLTRLRSAPPGPIRFTLRALDTASGKLLPRFSIPGNGEILSGLPIARLPDRRGRVVYTLYWEDAGPRRPGQVRQRRISVLALDTAAPRLRRVELPRLRNVRDPMLLRLRLDKSGRRLSVVALSRNASDRRPEPRARIDTRTLRVIPRPRPLARATARVDVVGRTAGGREVRLRQLGNPNIKGRLLVFNCRGEDCASRGIEPRTQGCPDPHSNIYVVPTIHSDPRMAARIVRLVEPEVTIWLDLPPGELDPAREEALERAIVRLGREVGDDGDVARKG